MAVEAWRSRCELYIRNISVYPSARFWAHSSLSHPLSGAGAPSNSRLPTYHTISIPAGVSYYSRVARPSVIFTRSYTLTPKTASSPLWPTRRPLRISISLTIWTKRSYYYLYLYMRIAFITESLPATQFVLLGMLRSCDLTRNHLGLWILLHLWELILMLWIARTESTSIKIKYICDIYNFFAWKYISSALEYMPNICQIYFGKYISLLWRKFLQNIF